MPEILGVLTSFAGTLAALAGWRLVEAWRNKKSEGVVTEAQKAAEALREVIAELSRKLDECQRAAINIEARLNGIRGASENAGPKLSTEPTIPIPGRPADDSGRVSLGDLVKLYDQDPGSFKETRSSQFATVLKNAASPSLELAAAGAVRIFEHEQRWYAVPFEDLIVNEGQWKDSGLGSVFECDPLSSEPSRFSVDAPAELTALPTNSEWVVSQRGKLRLRSLGQ